MLKQILLSLMLIFGILNAEVINITDNIEGIEVNLTSEKSLVVGNNIFIVTLSKNDKLITDGKVKIKFFMPEMPGMPAMENKQKSELVDGKYIMNIHLSMGGTWQYKLYFKTSDDKKYNIRGSVNI